MTDGNYSSKTTGIRGIIKTFFTFLLVVAVFFVIGVGLYYGVPYAYNQLVKPVEEHTAQIGDLQAEQKQSATEWDERINDLRKQIDALTTLRDKDKETIAEVQTNLEQASGWQEGDKQLAARLGKLETRMDEFESQQRTFETALAVLKTASGEDAQKLDKMDRRVQQQETPLADIRQETYLIKVMALITRSRAALLDRNYGVAEGDLQAARRLVKGVQAGARDFQTETLQTLLVHIDLALNNLSTNPVLADKDLEIVWQLLVQGLPVGINDSQSLPFPSTPVPTDMPADLPTALPTVLPTPVLTPNL